LEIIVVGNGSSDATAEIARRFKVRVISELRKGVASARQVFRRRRQIYVMKEVI
jgi:glycosyltransferase involved in cell wall biosynthesis